MIPLPDPTAIIERGRKCRAVLDNPDFMEVVDELTQFHLAGLVAAPPGARGKDAVEYHHTMQHAVTQLVGQLQGWAEAGDAMEQALDYEPED